MGLMSEKTGKGPRLVFVIKDGIRGHENQSAGIAWWLQELGGSKVVGIDVPVLSGFERFLRLKVLAQRLRGGDERVCRKWLEGSAGEGIREFVLERILDAGVKAKDVLFLSAGSSAAPWCLALARALGGQCCTLMTPSVIGTDAFDFAIVPEHDFPKSTPNMIVTLGAPNMIRPGLMEEGSRKLAEMYPPSGKERWAVLLGGDDGNYTLSPSWVERTIPDLLHDAEKKGADVYITTSRRTSHEAGRAVIEAARGRSPVRAIITASNDDWNPVPGMLGLCQKVFCTEDSVSMISEAATAGCDVRVLPLEHRVGLGNVFQKAAGRLAASGLFPERWIWGVPRFDRMMKRMKEEGLLDLLPEEYPEEKPGRTSAHAIFNEACRSARCIIERYGC